MAEWNEKDHPRDPDGKFTDANGTYRQNTRYDYILSLDHGPSNLTKKEWAKYYAAISDKKLGHPFSKLMGMDAIRIGKKIILSSGTFEDPIVEHVLVLGSPQKVDKFMEKLKYGKR